MELRDLPPKHDPKGGSPKTPIPPMSVSEYGYATSPQIVSNGSAWKAVSGGLIGLLAGMTVAWFTAMQARGVSQKEMEDFVRQSQIDQEKTALTRAEMHEYVDKYSPWNFDKQTIIRSLAIHDQNIGELRTKIDLAAKYLEQQQSTKK